MEKSTKSKMYGFRRFLVLMLTFCMLATFTPLQEVHAEGTYTVTYLYSGTLPDAVMNTLPADSSTYEDGDTITPENPSSTEVVDGTKTYTFEGWSPEGEQTFNGDNITFTGSWDVEDENDTGGSSPDDMSDAPTPNPPAPSTYADDGLVTILSSNQIGDSGTHITTLDKGYGVGICCYHTRRPAGVGSVGYISEITAAHPYYENIRRAMYWGFEVGDDETELGHAFSIHIMLSYWMNGNDSLSSGICEGTKRFKSAKKYCNGLYDKGAVPENFHIYQWIGTGAASKKQIMVTYKVVNSGFVKLKKSAASSSINYPSAVPNNYSLAGAVYYLYNADGSRAYDVNYNYVTLVTDANGDTPAVEVFADPAGTTYIAKEQTASKGFLLDDTADSAAVTIGNTAGNPAVINSTEIPTVGRLMMLQKYDKTGDLGWRNLLGAEYTLRYYDVDPDTADVSNLTPTRSWVFKTVAKTDDNGKTYAGINFAEDQPVSGDAFYMEKVIGYNSGDESLNPSATDYYKKLNYFKVSPSGTSQRVMPIGVFTIEETKAPRGLARNATVYYGKVKQPSNGKLAKTSTKATSDFMLNVNTNELDNAEEQPKVKLVINKVKQQTDEAKAEESQANHSDTRKGLYSTLAGAKYEVYYNDSIGETPILVGYITTDANGKGELSKRTHGPQNFIGQDLRKGHYLIKEVTPAPGFLLDKYELQEDGSTKELNNADIEVICDYEADGTPVKKTISGSYKDGMHLFEVKAFGDEAGVSEYTATVKSKDAGTETYIKKTDATTTEELPGATLQVYSLNEGSNGVLVEQWVSTEEDHLIKELPSGKYLLREITAPYGYDVAEDIEFEVSDSKVVNKVEMANKPIEIGTIATDTATNAHHGIKAENGTIKDVVTLSGLYEGRTYQVKGTLMDKATGEALKDAQGHDITAQSDPFVATGDSMEITIDFHLDSSQFDLDKIVVAFERLYRTEQVSVKPGHPARDPQDDLPVDLAKHEDLEDEAQSIHYGGIVETVATDVKSEAHVMLGEEGATIKDVVEYKNLSTETTYKIEGELFDKMTGELTGVKASKEFKPETPDGTIELEFTIDASQLTNHTFVAYETLLVNDVEVSEHKDPEDEDQSVHVPEIETNALDAKTEDHISNGDEEITIIDRVTYKNLVPDMEYTVKGVLMNAKTGKAILVNDKEVTSEVKFTPEEADGFVDMTFKFDGRGVRGEKIVAFEEVHYNNVPVAVHADLEDEDQSVYVPKIETVAVNTECNDHVAMAGKLQIKDTVTYKSLIPNKKYTLKGTLQYRDGLFNTLRPVEKDGAPLTAEVEFIPTATEGTQDVMFEFDATGLEGKTTVVFEDLYYGEFLVATHADPDDEDQSVYIPKISTEAELDGKVVIDTIRYENLTPGKYVMRGYLVNPDTEKKLKDSDGEFEFEITEAHASGEVEVELPVSYYEKLRGYKLVAFEECYIVVKDENGGDKEVLVAEHKDSTDESQTVKIPKAKKPDTGENTGLFIFGGIFAAAVIALAVIMLKKKDSEKEDGSEDKEKN